MAHNLNILNEALSFIKERLVNNFKAETAVILGSGLFHFANNLKKSPHAQIISFSDIPNMVSSTVEGHMGELICANNLIALSGRCHLYEGYSPEQITLPIRLLGLLGIKNLIITNAAGGINPSFEPGDLMAISDHLNLTGLNPLSGPNIEALGPRFVDMSQAYDPSLREIALSFAKDSQIKMHQGVYAGVLGPCYETPAEIRMFKTLGADAVGMSTVLENIVAQHMGIKVLGLSCITNKAAGLSSSAISHEEVMEINQKMALKFSGLLEKITNNIK